MKFVEAEEKTTARGRTLKDGFEFNRYSTYRQKKDGEYKIPRPFLTIIVFVETAPM